ncbi:MAG: spore germination protein [Firmicutes bacterium HGW-Firmicutes-16]|nr:MAG: spore germination protein [Firmicutes bacterium HGW-Firmicutes-16]
MFNYIQKVIRYRKMTSSGGSGAKESPEAPKESSDELSEDLEANIQLIQGIIVESNDLNIRRFVIGKKVKAAIIYIDGLVDKTLVNETILKPLMYHSEMDSPPETVDIDYVESELLFVGGIDSKQKVNEAVNKILSGDTVFLMDGAAKALIIALRGWKMRGIEEPETEATVRGPREGFTETLRINTSMIRRKIKNPNLKFETLTVGDRTKTDVCIAYITDLAKPELIEEVKRRLNKIKTEAVLESGYIEQYIEDAPYSIFATVGNSEKPDKVAAKLLDGRVAIIIDGTPFVLTVPCVFIESFQSPEDYYSRFAFTSALRMIRFTAFFISILAPAIYVALSTFHQELIPTQLILSMAAAHEGVPFPSLVEATIMLLFFEILREAGVRLPRPIGQAVSIVGALVIGEAAVTAGLIGAPMVIVIAVTAVSSFTIPAQLDSGTIIRIVLLILAGFLGGFGIAIGMFALLIHMVNLESFGTPYLMPIAPFDKSGLKDSFIRAPLWTMLKRPKGMSMDDVKQKKPSGPPPFNEN